MRLGIYGGSFDPIHIGHLLLAESCREQCRLDRIEFIPAGIPPHKLGRELSPGLARAEMLELAVAGIPEFSVNRSEIKRTGPSYTVETLREMRNLHPDDELFLLLGADSVRDFPQWHEPGEIGQLADLIIVNRGTDPTPDPDGLRNCIGAAAVSRIQQVHMPSIAISASNLRERLRDGHSVRFQVPRAVECYISEHKLYCP